MKKFTITLFLFISLAVMALPAIAAPPIVGQTMALSASGLQYEALPIAASTQAKALGQSITAAAYPTPTIITGDLSVSFPSLELQLSTQSQDTQKAVASVRNYQRALVFFDLVIIIGILFLIVLIVARTKVLKTLGLTKLSDDAASSPGASGASSKA
jgi:hypothetical protein